MSNPTIVGISRIINARGGWFHDGYETRGAIGPHEQMRLTVHPDNDGTYSIKSPDGSEWFSFDAKGEWSYRKDEPGQPGPWEKFTRDPDNPNRLVSVQFPQNDFYIIGEWPAIKPTVVLPTLSIRQRDWYDGETVYVPRWCGMLAALKPALTVDDWQTYIDYAIATGFTGVRVFAGSLEWADQSADGARDRLSEFLDVLAARGLACEVTAVTDSATGYDWREHLRDVLQICKGRQGVVVEAANEVGHGTQAADLTFENIREVVYDPTWDSLLVAFGAPVGTDEPDETGHFAGAGGDYMTAHLDRGRDYWNQCRRVRELFANVEAENHPCLDNEPLGAAEHAEPGKRENDPPFFACLGALDRAFQGVGGVHHSDAGLDCVPPGEKEQACASAYVEAHLAVQRILGARAGRYYNSGHEGSPVGRYTDEQYEHEIIRHYSFVLDDARGASIAIGVSNPNLKFTWQNGYKPVGEPVEFVRALDGSKLLIFEVAR